MQIKEDRLGSKIIASNTLVCNFAILRHQIMFFVTYNQDLLDLLTQHINGCQFSFPQFSAWSSTPPKV